MRIVIVGGGTGGHLYPGIAVAQELKCWDPRARIMFIGARDGLERDIVLREGYRHFKIAASGLARRRRREQVVAVGYFLQGFGQAVRVLRRVQPQVVLGLGSYVSGAVLLAAGALGIPRLVHEQNVIPGLTNRLLGRVVNRMAVSNARTLVAVGAAEVRRDQALNGCLLAERIRHYLSHPEAIADMAARCLALGEPDAATRVAQLCLQLCRI
jgi:UDP-N-acetylglucosamine--N-acetylmuramyl-(pentapeptide) pyrophosphoryl-undecaprenol N-acetylglucosamine transferase